MAKTKRPGLRKLVAMCPHMARIHALYGAPPPRNRDPGFDVLLRIIVDQQVSTHSGAAIWRKLEAGLGDVTPQSVLTAGEDGLRACGFSGAKACYGYGLARAVDCGTLDLDKLSRMSDERAQDGRDLSDVRTGPRGHVASGRSGAGGGGRGFTGA